LNAGADVDAKTPELGTTSLMRAVQQDHLLVVRLLISYGADLELVNSNQENIFHMLAKAALTSSTSSSTLSPSLSQVQEQRDQGNNKFLELARWLKVKASSESGRFQRMLQALDLQGQRPLDYLQSDSNGCVVELQDLLTPDAVVTAN
jgi:ankyrin repeat protein